MSRYVGETTGSFEEATVDPESGNRKPRWPLIVAIVVAAAFLGLMIVLHLSGGLGPNIH
jgi:hypothetical protein